ncbi:MAG TPA: gamma-glutamyltransferase [Saprospiraceae bacterium]|nr:gamma-glutamyltransferase [Saprospiraceae bacterium]
MRKLFLSFFLLTCLLSFNCNTNSSGILYNIQKSALSTNGMVVTAHPLATQVGVEILKQGGNAADAAIAVQLALAVVYPRAGNLGGGGFMVYRDREGEVSTLDFRERAPGTSHRNMYLDNKGEVVPGLSNNGILASGIPGTVAGLIATHEKLGKLQPWSSLVQPAIELAEKGFRITESEAQRLNSFQKVFSEFNPSNMPFLKKKAWQQGDKLVQKDLASTLRLIAEKGLEGFYSGTNADALVSLSKEKNGIISKEDLESYQPVWRPPFSLQWRDYKIYTMGLPSSGGIIMGQILKMIDDKVIDSLGNRDPYNVHLIVEAERRAFADRSVYLGDADYVRVPVDSLLQQSYLENRFKSFHPLIASKSIAPDSTIIHSKKESFETTHFSIVDSDGNAIAVTTTLNDNYGSKVWVPGGGYFLNNEMDDFSIKPGVPNMFGLIGSEANSIAPGKRMLSSMTPTIVEKNGNLWLVLGSPGGPTIITSVLQVFLNVAVFDIDINLAVQQGRYHHQWLPDEIIYEKNTFSSGLINELTAMGHPLRSIEALGLIEAILIDGQGPLHGVADQRGDDHAAGW